MDLVFRELKFDDVDKLLPIYSNALNLPYFNSDNCDDNFFYDTKDKMVSAVNFWIEATEKGWFIRQVIEFKRIIIGTIEICFRPSNDFYNNMIILRIDVDNKYEKMDIISNIIKYALKYSVGMHDCKGLFIKGPEYATERIKAFLDNGLELCSEPAICNDGNKYFSYYYVHF